MRYRYAVLERRIFKYLKDTIHIVILDLKLTHLFLFAVS